jgi:hypothetical protein
MSAYSEVIRVFSPRASVSQPQPFLCQLNSVAKFRPERQLCGSRIEMRSIHMGPCLPQIFLEFGHVRCVNVLCKRILLTISVQMFKFTDSGMAQVIVSSAAG